MDQRINLLTMVANKRKRKADDSGAACDTANASEISLACLEAERSKVKVSESELQNELKSDGFVVLTYWIISPYLILLHYLRVRALDLS